MVFEPTLITTKTVKLKGDEMLEAIWMLRREFITKWNKEPVGLLVGPIEYLTLIHHVRGQAQFTSMAMQYMANEIFGMPIYIKQSSGFELLIPYDMAEYFAKGKIE